MSNSTAIICAGVRKDGTSCGAKLFLIANDSSVFTIIRYSISVKCKRCGKIWGNTDLTYDNY